MKNIIITVGSLALYVGFWFLRSTCNEWIFYDNQPETLKNRGTVVLAFVSMISPV